jgi:beta-glucosidase
MPNTPLWEFGHGLSYTKFEYANLNLSAKEIGTRGSVEITADVSNVGNRAGHEVVQLYIRDVISSVTRPVKELKGFRKIALAPGEKKTVKFTLTPEELGFYDQSMVRRVEPGAFDVMIGSSSEQIRLKSSFEVR